MNCSKSKSPSWFVFMLDFDCDFTKLAISLPENGSVCWSNDGFLFRWAVSSCCFTVFNSRVNLLRSSSTSRSFFSKFLVYPFGNEFRANLSDTMHWKPSFLQFVHLGCNSDFPEHFIFLALHLSQAWLILVLPLNGFLIIFHVDLEVEDDDNCGFVSLGSLWARLVLRCFAVAGFIFDACLWNIK